ncbi:putative reverse transcriptase domain-containing protein [Tanacetum coccineum]
MAPKRATRSTPVTTTPAPTATTTTTVTNAQLQAMIDQGVSAALAARDATRNGIDSHTSGTGVRGSERVARECTYQDFMKCKPLYFKGTEGVVELTQWFERMETVFRISNCSVENQIKFSTCTLLAGALTWWNSHVMTVTHDVAYSMTWVDLRKKMTDKYCPRNEMKKLEAELWNLKVIGTDVVKYNQRFQELALLCVRMFPEESDKIERGTGNANNLNNQKGTGSGQKPTCFECGAQGHFKKECPRMKNNKGNRGNQAGNDRAPAKVYVVGNAGANPDNVVAGTFLLNNRYAYILFDTGADRSFVSTTFSSQIDITPSTLDHYYDVELADGRIIGLNTILKGCTLNFLNHQFNINLMPVELGSFDAIIGMDWLAKYQAVIMCAEKIVRIPWKNKTLIIHGDGSTQGNVTRLNIISCTKTQKYMEKGFPIFLAHVTTKEVEDKSEKKRLEDVPIVQDFPEVFPEDLPGLPPTRQVEFQIDLVPGAAPVARAPYRLAPSEMKELSEQLKELSDKGFIRPSSSPWGAPVLFVKKKDGSFRIAPILALPEGSEDFIAYCDASKKGLGAVLMQREKVISYASRQLKIHEKNYTTHDLELGAGRVRFSDSGDIIYMENNLLSDYDCDIRYHPGKANVVADAFRGRTKETITSRSEHQRPSGLLVNPIPEWKWRQTSPWFCPKFLRRLKGDRRVEKLLYSLNLQKEVEHRVP